jgi:organic hydroperoxide reductase OsmC/OhrA
MSDTQQFSFTLEQQEDFAFLIRFDKDISRLLAASVANCLSASLLFALRKFKNNPGPITTVVTAHMERNEEKRLRVGRVDVMIQVDSPADSLEHLDRVLDQFEDFCVVTQSVRSGFPVTVTVRDGAGKVIKG